MHHDATIDSQDPNGMKGQYACPECRRETNHSVLSIINANHFDESGLVQFWDHYLTVRCEGCGTVSFCHVAKCSENEDYRRARPIWLKRRPNTLGLSLIPPKAPASLIRREYQSLKRCPEKPTTLRSSSSLWWSSIAHTAPTRITLVFS